MKSIFLGVLALGVVLGTGLAVAQDHQAVSMKADKALSAPANHNPSPGPGPLGGVPAVIKGGPVANPGASPLGCSLWEGGNTVYVVGLFDGLTQTFDRNLNPTGSFPSPAGTNTTTGLAVTLDTPAPVSGQMYYVDATTDTLFVTDLAGGFLGSFPMSPAVPGLPAGLAFDANTGTLWVDDIASDDYREYDLGGTATGNSFLNPADIPPGTGAFGNGIAWRVSDGAFDLPVGTLGDGAVTDISTTTNTGTVLQTINVASLGTFINGIHDTLVGSDGAPSIYVVENASNTVYEIGQLPPVVCVGVGSLVCDYDGTQSNLSWVNQDTYASIEIDRDGSLIATLAGTATSYSDVIGPGTYNYVVRGICPAGPSGGTGCTVVPTMGSTALLFLGLILLSGTFFVVTRRVQGHPVQA